MNGWFPIPSVAEERAHAIGAPTAWRYNKTMLRIVYSVLAAVAVLALFGFVAIVFHVVRGVVTAAVAIGVSESLIRKHRFFGTGLESSLWLCGVFAFIFGLPSQGKVEAILVFALAAALSGWRMRNAVFGVLSAILIVAYIAAKWDPEPVPTIAAACVIAVAAAIAMRRRWSRPSTERLFAGLVLSMPVAGYLGTVVQNIFRSNPPANVSVAIILAATALVLLIAGIASRDRAILVSAFFSIVLAIVEVRDLINYPSEAKLIGAGILMIAIAAVLARALRNATRGFVVTPVRVGGYDEAMQIGGIISVAPHGSAPASQHHSGPELADSAGPTDKSYGGGGAGGGF
jgi:MFS family permease